MCEERGVGLHLGYYQTVKALRTIRNERCTNCFNAKLRQDGYSNIGIHDLFLTYDLGNLGMITSRERWNELRAVGQAFCTFDDYNWDSTMNQLAASNAIAPLSITTSFPRAEHMGMCGVHSNHSVCDISVEDKHHFDEMNNKLQDDGGNWENIDSPNSPRKGRGGWGHPMDHQHCIDQIKKVT